MKRSKITVTEMARKAGVSVATISRAMGDQTRHKVAPDTLRRIDSLVRKYGYTLNLAAKHLRQSSTKTIGIIFPSVPGIFYSEYYTRILAGLTEYILDTEYRFKMLFFKNDRNWDGYNFRAGEGVDGLIVVHWYKIFSSKTALECLDIPCVCINDFDKTIKAAFVCADQFDGGYKAAQYLYGQGHRYIGVLSGPEWSVDNRLRLQGFQAYLKSKGIRLDSNQIRDGKYLAQEAYGQIQALIEGASGITAIFCCNDQMAVGALRKLNEMGIKCPGDISLIGFDDESLSPYTVPPLTTVHVDVPRLGQRAAQMLLEVLKGTATKSYRLAEIVPVSLVERNSVGRIV